MEMHGQPQTNEFQIREALQWRKTAFNRYERPLDDLEFFFGLIHTGGAQLGRQHWALSTGIRIHLQQANFAEKLRHAWIALRYQHPILACQAEDGRLVYRIADDAELQEWLKETFVVHDSKVTARELYGTTSRPLKRVICHVLPHSQEVLLQGTHAHLDGLGAVTLFDNLLRTLSNPKKVAFGDEAKNLLPPLGTIARIPEPTAAQTARWESSLNKWVSNHPTLRLGATNIDKIPGRSQVQNLIFSKTSTTRIIKTARKLGLTVTQVAQAAIALASRIHGARMEQSTLATFAIYNARNYCDPSFYSPSTLVGPHLFAAPVTFQLGSFLDTAHSVREHFVSERADDYALTMMPAFTQSIPLILATPQPVPPSTPLLSSFGSLDSRFQRTYGEDGEIKLVDFWCTLDMVTPDTYMGLWTFQGRLTLEVGYNEVFHERESIERLLGLVKEQLAEGLGLELETEG